MRSPMLVAVFTLSALPASAAVTDTDLAFLTTETQGATYELAIAKLAATRATKPAVKAYARKIVTDHSTANPALKKLVAAKGVTIPAGMSADDKAKYQTLQETKGAAFDTAYVAEVTRINADDETSFKREADVTKDPQIVVYVKKFGAMDAAHKKMGEALK